MPVLSTAHAAMQALVLGTILGVGAASAQMPSPSTSSTTPLPTQAAPLDPKAGLELTPAQRTKIFQKATEQKDRVKTPPQGVTAAVGAELPASMELYTVPDDIMLEIPNTKLYKYTMVSGQVLMVDPTSMKVVDVIRN